MVVVRSGLRLSVAEAEARAVKTLRDNAVDGFDYGGRVSQVGPTAVAETWIVGVGQFVPANQ